MSGLGRTSRSSLLDLVWRTAFRLGFPLARIWWQLTRPRHEGAMVAVYIGPALLLVRSSYRIGWHLPGGGVRRHYEWYFRTPDGEAYEAFSARVADWLGSAGDRSVIVVTHGIVSRVLRGLYAGLHRTAALRLPVPQDRVFRLVDGAIDEIAIGPSAAHLTS